ncbi:P-loop containing nucleoside triphosphate hydrolase protein [Syncephalis plumigaleata]|nr:P-loop containing nucleoside triphosphate hydrolase protein [Syncephalis plumigaleata]
MISMNSQSIWSIPIILLLVGAQIAFTGILLSRGYLEDTASGRIPTLEDVASVLDCVLYTWIGPLLSIGAQRHLDDCDMWELPKNERTNIVSQQYRQVSRQSLLRGILSISRADIFFQFVFAILWSVLLYAIPYFMYLLLLYVSNYNGHNSALPWIYGICMLVAMIGSGVFYQQAHFIGQRLRIRSKTIMLNQIFHKCLNKLPENIQDFVSIYEKSDSASFSGMGRSSSASLWDSDTIACMLKTEAEDIAESLSNIHISVGGVIQVVLALALLWHLIGISVLLGLVGMALIAVFVGVLSIGMSKSYGILIIATDNRKSYIQEALQNIHNIRILAWESLVLGKIKRARNLELDALWYRQLIYAGFIMSTRGGSLVIFGFALGAYVVFFSNTLDAPTAFTCLVLFELLTSVVIQFPDIIYWYYQCISSNRRITTFLSQPEQTGPMVNDYMDIRERSERIAITDGEFSWYQQEEIEWHKDDSMMITRTNFNLTGIHIEFKLKEINVIVGAPRSGKTSLLMALLDEMPRTSGFVYFPRNRRVYENYGTPNNSVAFVAQKPWIRNATIRDNIIFGRFYDETRYHQVLQSCALEYDIDNLYAGDQTMLGEDGFKLSLSLEQRISFARAVYSQAKHLLIDDCFSDMEPGISEHIISSCILGPLMAERTIILVTKELELLTHVASFAVMLKKGHVAAKGQPAHVLEHMKLSRTSTIETISESDMQCTSGVLLTDFPIYSVARKPDTTVRDSMQVMHDMPIPGAITNIDMFNSCKVYFHLLGSYKSWIATILLLLLCQAMLIGSFYWIERWTGDEKGEQSSAIYYSIYTLIIISSVLTIGISTFRMYKMGIDAGRNLHNKLVNRIMYANIKLFDTTSVEVILRRLFQQSIIIDQELSINITALISQAVALLAYLTAIIIIIPVFAPIALLLVIWYLHSSYRYLATSNRLKSLAVHFKDKFMLLFNEALRDPVTLRASGIQYRLMAEGEQLIDAMSRPSYLQSATNQWMLCRARIISVIALLSTLVMLLLSIDHVDASTFGFTLVCALMFSFSAINAVEHMTKCGMSMDAIKFTEKCQQIQREVSSNIGVTGLSKHWPNLGEIEIKTLSSMKTGNSYLPVHSLSISIRSGEQVGIYGRTVTERFSVPAALLRFIEGRSGHIFIDGIDINQVPLRDLRSRVTFITNKPSLLSGTIRNYVDPFGIYEDEELYQVLYRCHIISDEDMRTRTTNSELVDLDMEVDDMDFSLCEQRLLAVAQGILRNNKIVIIDESITEDNDTDAQVQQIVHTEFKGVTIFFISPQPHLAVEYDHILVFDEERPAEWDTPANLIHQEHSNFRAICERFGDIELLKSMSLNRLKRSK